VEQAVGQVFSTIYDAPVLVAGDAVVQDTVVERAGGLAAADTIPAQQQQQQQQQAAAAAGFRASAAQSILCQYSLLVTPLPRTLQLKVQGVFAPSHTVLAEQKLHTAKSAGSFL
jgi:hypothetical protein